MSVFPDVFRSERLGAERHVFGGVDVQLYRGLYATVEGRYTKSSAKLGPDFIDFDPIDLSGLQIGGRHQLLF